MISSILYLFAIVSIFILMNFQQTVEAIGQAAGSSIQGHVTTIMRDVVLPGFERSCQRTFHQVNETFQKGTQECKLLFIYITDYSSNSE